MRLWLSMLKLDSPQSWRRTMTVTLLWPSILQIYMTRTSTRAQRSCTKTNSFRSLSMRNLIQKTSSLKCTIHWMKMKSASSALIFQRKRWISSHQQSILLRASWSIFLHARSKQARWRFYRSGGQQRTWPQSSRPCVTQLTKTRTWLSPHPLTLSTQTTNLSFSTRFRLDQSVQAPQEPQSKS